MLNVCLPSLHAGSWAILLDLNKIYLGLWYESENSNTPGRRSAISIALWTRHCDEFNAFSRFPGGNKL